MLKKTLLIPLCLLSIFTFAQKKNSSYRLHIRKTTSPIQVDGEMDELAWKNTDSAANFFMVLPMDTSKAKVRTTVRMAYDAKKIYMIKKIV